MGEGFDWGKKGDVELQYEYDSKEIWGNMNFDNQSQGDMWIWKYSLDQTIVLIKSDLISQLSLIYNRNISLNPSQEWDSI